MVELMFYNSNHYDDLNYNLNEEQSKFTFTIDFCINERKDLYDSCKNIITIINNRKPVGFFILDMGKDKLLLKNNENAILLRTLSINPNTQGQGIGKKAMSQLSDFVLQNYENINEILLSVHKYNISANKLYLSAGFVDTTLEILSPTGEDLSILSLKLL
ncbi:GNAT family N-acetyltransferase [Faecalibacter macacae]|uniref:GNAT family N-acetyltransferase n=1 Tax=Faecalibacter macacae TaxID=1859289 RepID=A0A3L9M091_9FLAO|nr:GNAT family N-acetyltransferase [Faecalibacter macacae]RLZ06395.1 GNAT family N-acetyltransferase [Faecalibacter macacae]